MGAAEMIAIMQLVTTLTPQAVNLVNSINESLKDVPAEDRMKTLKLMSDTLKPMQIKA